MPRGQEDRYGQVSGDLDLKMRLPRTGGRKKKTRLASASCSLHITMCMEVGGGGEGRVYGGAALATGEGGAIADTLLRTYLLSRYHKALMTVDPHVTI